MADEQKSNSLKKLQAINEKIQNRLKNLYSSKDDLPASISIRQAEQLKARVQELEDKLARLPEPQPKPGSGFSVPVTESMIESSGVPEDKRKSNALRITMIGVLASIVAASFYLFLALQFGAWQLYAWSLDIWILALAVLTGMFLVRRNRTSAGIWVVLAAIPVTFLAAVALIEGLGLLLGISIVVLVSIIAGQTLPTRGSSRATAVGLISGVAAILLDLYLPPYRLLPPDPVQVFLPGILGTVIFLFGIVTVRQFVNYSMRTKLVLAFVSVSLISVGSVAYLVDRAQRINLAKDIRNNLEVLSISQANQVGQVVVNEFNVLRLIALSSSVQDRSQTASSENTLRQAEINEFDLQWQAADAAGNNNDPLVSRVLRDPLSAELRRFQASYPEHAEIFLTDREGVNVAATNRTSDYFQADEEWWQIAVTNGLYIGQPDFDASTGIVAINMAVPVRARWGDQIVGVLRSTVNINSLGATLAAGRFGETGATEIYLPGGQELELIVREDGGYDMVMSETEVGTTGLENPTGELLTVTEDGVPSLIIGTVVTVPAESDLQTAITGLGWYVAVLQEQTEAYAPIEDQTRNNILLVLIVALLAAAAAVGLAQMLAGPLIRLNQVAEKVASGDLAVSAKVETGDETGILARTFNTMLSQLRGLVGTLEQRVTDRTHDLALAAEVGRAVSEKTADLYNLLIEAVTLIGERFDLYYTQIYLADPDGRGLTLRAGTGEVGAQLIERGHRLPVGPGSLNGRAAAEKRAVIVPDTTQNPNFLPNPLLPDTRSEMAVPLLAGGLVVGVLDMQSNRPEALNESNLPAFEALAAQLAIAIQNSALFAEARQARQEVEGQVRRLTEQGWRDYLDAIEREEQIGFAFDQTSTTALKTGPLTGPRSAGELNTPITVTGTRIGAIQVAGETDRRWTDRDIAVLQTTATQLAQHIENLRLLAQAEKYRAEAEQTLRRLTREGWEGYLQTGKEPASGFVYDLNMVHPLQERSSDGNAAVRHPLIVRNETIGELSLGGNSELDGTNEVVRAVAQQLSSHLENLRLTELNEKRAYELSTVATVSTTASTVLDPDKLLQSVVDMTRERFGVYHAHIYLANEAWNTLLLTAGAGSVGRQMAADGHNIPIDAERSLVARAARERQAAIVNDVRADPGFLANPRLPDTRSEMAVPMIVGDRVLGVFDVQSDKVNGFGREDADIYATLAAQVAVALQNARLYVEQSATVTQLRELDRLKSSFLANMSHELRTPLNSILGFADVMLEELDGPLTPNMNNDLQLISKNGQHLLHLINDVLDMAKIEAGKMNLSPEEFRIQETLEEAVSITSPLAAEKSIPLTIDAASDKNLQIYADRTRIRQVMINLVNNAVKFTEHGEITVRAERAGDNVLISVRDTGVGIEPDKLEAVFQEFTQVDTSTTRKAGGTGLGLPISRKLIDMHGGRMWAESTGVPGAGSTFYVELPIEARIVEPVEKRER